MKFKINDDVVDNYGNEGSISAIGYDETKPNILVIFFGGDGKAEYYENELEKL